MWAAVCQFHLPASPAVQPLLCRRLRRRRGCQHLRHWQNWGGCDQRHCRRRCGCQLSRALWLLQPGRWQLPLRPPALPPLQLRPAASAPNSLLAAGSPAQSGPPLSSRCTLAPHPTLQQSVVFSLRAFDVSAMQTKLALPYLALWLTNKAERKFEKECEKEEHMPIQATGAPGRGSGRSSPSGCGPPPRSTRTPWAGPSPACRTQEGVTVKLSVTPLQ